MTARKTDLFFEGMAAIEKDWRKSATNAMGLAVAIIVAREHCWIGEKVVRFSVADGDELLKTHTVFQRFDTETKEWVVTITTKDDAQDKLPV